MPNQEPLAGPSADLEGSDNLVAQGSNNTINVTHYHTPPTAPRTPQAGWFWAHPYGDVANFTGRVAERARLSAWLQAEAEPLLLVRALGGFGKSALAWQWVQHEVDAQAWPLGVWWSFYETDAGFENFLRETLDYLGYATQGRSARQQVSDLLGVLAGQRVLLVLDGFERELRLFSSLGAAYQGDGVSDSDEPALRDCVSPAAEHFLRGLCGPRLRGKVLLTTRLTPRCVEGRDGRWLGGCAELALAEFAEEEVLAYFKRQHIQGTRAELLAASAAYGHHPLSLSLLAGVVNEDPERPGDIAVALVRDVHGALTAKHTHILQHAYDRLRPAHQTLLSQLACFRGAMEYATLKAVFGSTHVNSAVTPAQAGVQAQPLDSRLRGNDALLNAGVQTPTLNSGWRGDDAPLNLAAASLETALKDLRQRGLLHHNATTKRYDLHPLVRHYAYERLTQKAPTHQLLIVFFQAVPPPERFATLSDLEPLIELYHHTVQAGQLEEALQLFYERIGDPLLYQFGAYRTLIELLRALFPAGEDQPPALKTEADQAWTLNALANAYSLSGQPRRAVRLFEMHNQLRDKAGDKRNLAVGLGNLAQQQIPIGALRAAEANLRRSIALCREVDDEFWEAVGHAELGRVLAYLGRWAEAAEALDTAWQLFEKRKNVQGQSIVAAYRALCALLMARAQPQSLISSLQSAGLAQSPISYARTALTLAEETARDSRFVYPVRDFISAHWLLGAALCAAGQWAEAEQHLTEALQRCRAINLVEVEADILLDLARLRLKQGEREEAERLALEGLAIAERCGYGLQAADAHLVLAQLALTPIPVPSPGAGEGDSGREAADRRERGLFHARAALRLAECEGEPYVYRVAYEEAKKIVES